MDYQPFRRSWTKSYALLAATASSIASARATAAAAAAATATRYCCDCHCPCYCSCPLLRLMLLSLPTAAATAALVLGPRFLAVLVEGRCVVFIKRKPTNMTHCAVCKLSIDQSFGRILNSSLQVQYEGCEFDRLSGVSQVFELRNTPAALFFFIHSSLRVIGRRHSLVLLHNTPAASSTQYCFCV